MTSMSAVDRGVSRLDNIDRARRLCFSGQQRVTHDSEMNSNVYVGPMGSIYEVYVKSRRGLCEVYVRPNEGYVRST